MITDANAQNPQCSGEDRISRLAALITELNASEHAAVFAGPTTLEPELLAAGNDAAVWTAWAAQHPRAWETAKAAVEAPRARARAAQHLVITADPPFAVIACPGAGKTRVIVDRHRASWSGSAVPLSLAGSPCRRLAVG